MATTDRSTRKFRSFGLSLGAYGIFLIALGVAGYLNNPAGAKTALISGGTFGTIHLVWAFLWKRRPGLVRVGALVSLLVVLAASSWRGYVSWTAYLEGEASKQFVAFLLTAMWLGTARILLRLLTLPRPEPGLEPTGTPAR